MDQKGILRLKEEQYKAVKSTEEQITTWEKFKSDYVALQERLRTLPDKVNHQVMVPFGSKAFMPGKLVHTNEILVLLGDNWFAERSAKQASEIIDRRLVGINKQLKDLGKQKELLRPRIGFTSELQGMAQSEGDVVDIQEEYDPEKEKRWREEHRKSVLEHRKKLKEKKPVSVKHDVNVESPTDRELWARLDELESIERSRQELSRLDLLGEGNQNSLTASDQTVRWADQEDCEDRLSSEEESDEGETTLNRPKSIKFSHTKNKDDSQVTEKSHIAANSGETTLHITSPADIYKLFNPKSSSLKSILKSSDKAMSTYSSTTPSKDDCDSEVMKTTKRFPIKESFTGSVIERDTTSAVSTTAGEPSITGEDSQSQPTRKRVSKFKAGRQKQKHTGDR